MFILWRFSWFIFCKLHIVLLAIKYDLSNSSPWVEQCEMLNSLKMSSRAAETRLRTRRPVATCTCTVTARTGSLLLWPIRTSLTVYTIYTFNIYVFGLLVRKTNFHIFDVKINNNIKFKKITLIDIVPNTKQLHACAIGWY